MSSLVSRLCLFVFFSSTSTVFGLPLSLVSQTHHEQKEHILISLSSSLALSLSSSSSTLIGFASSLCFSNGAGESFPTLLLTSDSMTPELCNTAAQHSTPPQPYFGVMNGNQCWGGTVSPTSVGLGCTVPCSGSPLRVCGGPSSASGFSTTSGTLYPSYDGILHFNKATDRTVYGGKNPSQTYYGPGCMKYCETEYATSANSGSDIEACKYGCGIAAWQTEPRSPSDACQAQADCTDHSGYCALVCSSQGAPLTKSTVIGAYCNEAGEPTGCMACTDGCVAGYEVNAPDGVLPSS